MFKMKCTKDRGITLIALVITIIVLLILAGVSIAMLTGQNGILTQANNAKIAQSHGAVKDCIALAYNEYQIEINTGSTAKLASTTKVTVRGEEKNYLANSNTFMDFLLTKGYITDKTSGKINVEKLTGGKQALGNGTGETDIYKVEENNGTYVVNYYTGEVFNETLRVTKDGTPLYTYAVDVEIPNIIISAEPSSNTSEVTSQNIVINVQSQHDISELKYKWTKLLNEPDKDQFIDNVPSSNNISTPSGESGNYYLWIYAKDVNGNEIISSFGGYKIGN